MPLEQVASKRRVSQHFCLQEKLRILKEWHNTGDRFLVAKKYGVHPRTLYRWKAAAKESVNTVFKINEVRDEKGCVSRLAGNDVFCNFNLSEAHIALCENSPLLFYNAGGNGQSVMNELDLIRLKYFIKGISSGYNRDELVELIGLVDVEKSYFDSINICIAFAQNKVDTLHRQETNESSLQQIMLRRDIAFVTSYLKELQKIDSKNKSYFSKNIILPIDQGNLLEKEKRIDPGVDSDSNIELKGKACETVEIEFSERRTFGHVSDSVDSNWKVKNFTKKLISVAKSKSSYILKRIIRLFSKNSEDIRGGVKSPKKKRAVLFKTTSACFFIALIYFAVYMNILHGPGYCRSILSSFWRYFPVGAQ